MPLIHAIEVSNFMNHSRRLPWAPDWRYERFVLGGYHAAFNMPNGRGKSTMILALFAMLTWHRKSLADIRSMHCAPPSDAAFTHYRIEITKRNAIQADLLMAQVGPSDGEHMVFGIYGNAGDGNSFDYYAYNGTFDDCPIAHRDSGLVTLVSKNEFVSTLQKQNGVFPASAKERRLEEWRRLVSENFDMSSLQQQLAYQLAKGAEGSSTYFDVGDRRGANYSEALFYKHLAPELLTELMGSFGEEGEKGIEDTVYEKSRSVVVALRRARQVKRELVEAERILNAFESLSKSGERIRDARATVLEHRQILSTDLRALEEVLFINPVPGVPKAPGVSEPRFYEHFVLQDGQWWMTDRGLAAFSGEEPKVINQRSDRNNIHSSSLKKSQVIDIARDHGSGYANRVQGGGKATKIYNRDAAVALISTTVNFAREWTRERALAALSDGFRWAQSVCDTNPARHRMHEIGGRIAEHNETIEADRIKDAALMLEKGEAEKRRETFKSGENALEQMRRSGLFSQSELDDPKSTGRDARAVATDAEKALNGHDGKVATLQQIHEEWRRFEAEHPGEIPRALAERLKRNAKAAEKALDDITAKLTEARTECSRLEQAHSAANVALRRIEPKLSSVESLAPQAAQFESLFRGESPDGLATRVTEEFSRITKSINGHEISLARLDSELHAINSFETVHPGSAPGAWLSERVALRSDLELRRANCEHGLEICRRQQESVRAHTNAAEGFHALFAGEGTEGLADAVVEATRSARAVQAELRQDLAQIAEDDEAAARFGQRFPGVSPRDWLTSRERKRREFESTRHQFTKTLSELRLQRASLDQAPVAPGEIARRVTAIAGPGGRPLYAFVQSLSLPAVRQTAVLTLFSALLFSPVFSTREEASAAAQKLADEKIESVVFEATSLKSFCEGSDIRFDNGIARSLFIGVTTRAVECLLDPGLIEREKRLLDDQITAGQASLDAAVAGLDEIAEDEDHVFDAQRAQRALEQDIPRKACELRQKIDEAMATLPGIERRSSKEALRSIASMVELEKALSVSATAGWAQVQSAISQLNGRADELAEQIRAANEAMQTMERDRDTEHLARRADAAIQDKVPEHAATLREELAALREKEPRLRERASPHSMAIINAAVGMHQLLEGLTLAQLREQHRQAKAHEADALHARDAAKQLIFNLEQSRDTAVTEFRVAGEACLQAVGLQRIQAYLDDENGFAFMKSSASLREQLVEARKQAHSRSMFDFEAAVTFVNTDGARQLAAIAHRLDQIETNLRDIADTRAKLQGQVNSMTAEQAGLVEARMLIDDAIVGYRKAYREIQEMLGEPVPVSIDELETRALYSYVKDWREGVPIDELAREMRDLCEEVAGEGHTDLQNRLRQARNSLKTSQDLLEKDINTLLVDPSSKLPEVVRVQLEQAKTDPQVIDGMLATSRHSYALNLESNTIATDHLTKEREGLSEWLSNFTLRLPDNLKTMKKVFVPKADARTGVQHAGFEIDATTIDTEGMKSLIEEVISMVEEIESSEQLQNTVSEDALNKIRIGQRERIRETFYRRVVIKPRIRLVLPAMSSRALEMQPNMASSGQGVAITFLWIRKLAEFVNEREIRRETVDSAKRKRIRDKMTSFTILDGAFSHLSDKKLIDSTLSGIEESIGSFQLIITGHEPSYENDFKRFPAFIVAREMTGHYMRSFSYHHEISKTDVNGQSGIATFHAIQLPNATVAAIS